MNTRIKFIKTEKCIVSVQNDSPIHHGIEQPIEMLIIIEQEGKNLVYNFNKKQANDLLCEMKRAVKLINLFR